MRGYVEHPVHTVDQIDVRVARRTVHRTIAGGLPAAGMRCRIILPPVSFGLHDPANQLRVIERSYDERPDEILGDFDGLPLVECAG